MAKKKTGGKAAMPVKVGRPSSYTPEMAARICEALAEGKSLREVLKQDGMPAKGTVMRWLADESNGEFRDQYARAREIQAETLAEDILEIADDGRNDFVEKTLKDGSTVVVPDMENIQRSRLRVDARKWLASKMAPKKYGDKVEVAGDAARPPSVLINMLSVKPDALNFEKVMARALEAPAGAKGSK